MCTRPAQEITRRPRHKGITSGRSISPVFHPTKKETCDAVWQLLGVRLRPRITTKVLACLLPVLSYRRDVPHPRTETNSLPPVVRSSISLKFQLLQKVLVGYAIAYRFLYDSGEPFRCVESLLFSRPIPRLLPAYSKRPQRVSAIVVRTASAI